LTGRGDEMVVLILNLLINLMDKKVIRDEMVVPMMGMKW
jgi:hypothetical protein